MYLDDQEPWDKTRGLKLLCRFNLLKAEGVLIWNSPEVLSPFSARDSVTLRGLEPSLLHKKRWVKKRKKILIIIIILYWTNKSWCWTIKDKQMANILPIPGKCFQVKATIFILYKERNIIRRVSSHYQVRHSYVPHLCVYLFLNMDSPGSLDSCSSALVSPFPWGDKEAPRPLSRWGRPTLGLPSVLNSSWIKQKGGDIIYSWILFMSFMCKGGRRISGLLRFVKARENKVEK